MLNKKVLSALTILICFASILALASCKSTEQEATWFHYSGKSVFVELAGNYTTGYEWTASVEGTAVQVKEDAYTPHDAPEGMVGVGGTWTCTLEAVCDGEATVNFTYLRPWNKTDIAESHSLQVTVRNGKISSVKEIIEEAN